MTLSNVKDIVVGIIKQSFTNKKTLDKFDDSSGVLTYNGSEIGAKINISEEENNAIKLQEDDSLFVEDKTNELQILTDSLNTITKYQKYVNTELDSCHCKLSSPYTPVVGQYVPFIKRTGSLEVNDGYVTIKPGQRVQINVCISYHNTANKNPANISYDIKDYTNDVVIDSVQPVDIGVDSYEYPCTAFCQYTNKTNSDCKIGLCVNTIWTNDIIDVSYTALTVQEIGRQITIDPVEHINKTQGIEDAPVGHIISHMGNNAPTHYLICDGAEYNIEEYPYLAQHFINEFGSVNYFGGDGITTFAVPDLRGEFLRGTGTATRDTGSGAEVGEHQDGTQHVNNYVANYGKGLYTPVRTQGESGESLPGVYTKDTDTALTGSPGLCSVSGSYQTNSSYTNLISNYTSRPTNTSVLYCIKYEPTYYMNIHNTNYLSTSLYSEEERVVGCWINGKPLYEKTITNIIPEFSTNFGTFATIENLDTLIQYHGFYINGNDKVSIPYMNLYNDKQYYIALFQRENMIKLSQSQDWGAIVGKTAIVTIQYTKTTDEENSFTSDMIKDYIFSENNNKNESYTDEELQQAISDIVNQINAEPAIEESIATFSELEEDEVIEEIISEAIDEPEIETTEGEEE